MSINLPETAFDPVRRAAAWRRSGMLAAAVVALLSGWQFFGLPGSPLKRNVAPSDMTGREYGLRDLFITADGTWTIYRQGYLDRMTLYVIKPDGILDRRSETPDSYKELDVSGVAHGSPKTMRYHSALDVSASPIFWYYVRLARPKDELPANPVPAPHLSSVPSYVDPPAGEPEQIPHYVPLKFFYDGERQIVPVLTGHDYWPSYDSYAFLDTSLWLTTDRARWLHLLRCDDASLPPSVELVASVEISAGALANRDVAVGRDPQRAQVFVLLPDGRRFWYHETTLAALSQDRLPGVWEREYAALDFSSLDYNTDFGRPLSQAAYTRIMRSLALLFLASLLSLAFLWRTPWKYISAVTTADTTSGSKSGDI